MIQNKIRAESEAQIADIELKKQLASKEADKRIAEIENQIYFATEQSKADANHYSLMKMIEAEQAQLTDQYLQKLSIEAMTHNTKLYFGSSIPNFISENVDAFAANKGTPDKKPKWELNKFKVY